MLWLARPMSPATSGEGTERTFSRSIVWKWWEEKEENKDSRSWEKRRCIAQGAMSEESMSSTSIATVLISHFGLAYKLASGISLDSRVTACALCHPRCQRQLLPGAYGCMSAKPGKAVFHLLPCIICSCWSSSSFLWMLENAPNICPGWGNYTESLLVSYSCVTDHPKTWWLKTTPICFSFCGQTSGYILAESLAQMSQGCKKRTARFCSYLGFGQEENLLQNSPRFLEEWMLL